MLSTKVRAFYLLRQTWRANIFAQKNDRGRLGMATPRYHIIAMSSARHPFLKRWLRSVILLLALAAGPVAADQSDPGLDRLFDELKRTGNTAEADRLTAEIWQRWVAHGSDRRAGRCCVNKAARLPA